MIELPEVVALGAQMDATLRGQRVAACERGNTPHKWVFYNREPAEFAEVLPGTTVAGASGRAKYVCLALEPGWELLVGDLGGRLTWHEPGQRTPAKHHLLLRFESGAAFSVAVQGWGFVQLVTAGEQPRWLGAGPAATDDDLTFERFAAILDTAVAAAPKLIAKAFLVSQPPILGIGNGYVQDILFRAGLLPTRRLADLDDPGRRRYYQAMRDVLAAAVAAGGRDTERDLFGRPGGYRPVLDKRALGRPCPTCGTPIEKIAYLGGSCYFCPQCQR